jgi:hypothetical protein
VAEAHYCSYHSCSPVAQPAVEDSDLIVGYRSPPALVADP